jgi:3-hydroxybutyryl-CoA dehydratase
MYFEDLQLGYKVTTGARTITDGMATLLINIGGFTLPFFNDEIAANKTPLGWRALPGRMVFALMGGLVESADIWGKDAGSTMFVGANNLALKKPVKVGDTIHLDFEIIEKKETKNPKWGLVVNKETLINQRGEIVCEVDINHLVERKVQ